MLYLAMLKSNEMTMEITYLELDGIRVPVPPQVPMGDSNEDVVARISEIMEHVERSESGCVALSSSASF